MPYIYTDMTRLTYGELWRFSRGPLRFLVGAAFKLLRFRGPIRYAVRHEDRTQAVERGEVAVAGLRAIEPTIADCERLGARLAFFQTVHGIGNRQGCGAVLFGPGTDMLIVVPWARAGSSWGGSEGFGCAIMSQLDDGTIISTTNLPQRLDTPPGFQIDRLHNASPAELLERHERILATCLSPAIPLRDQRELIQVLDEARRRTFDWLVGRGVWVPLSDELAAELGASLGED